MTEKEKHQQILKEVKATFILFAIVAIWHIGFGFGLNGIDIIICGMPLWFFVSTIGAFFIAVAGVIILLKFVFVEFDLGIEVEAYQKGEIKEVLQEDAQIKDITEMQKEVADYDK